MRALVVTVRDRASEVAIPLQAASVDVVCVHPPAAGLRGRVGWAHGVIQQAGRSGADVVVSYEPGPICLLAELACRGVPVLVRWRGDPWQEYEDLRQQGRASSVKIALGTRILTQSIRLCNRAVPVSRSLADSIRAHTRCRPQKVVPIPIPVDLARFTPVADRQAIKRQLGYEFKHIISLAMIFQYVQKVAGLERFLPALRAVVEHRQDTAVVIAGGGRLLQPFRQRHAALLDHPRIILPGHVDGVHRLIQASDIFCHFSYFDACPNVILEAWACATPVVVNDYPALVEHLEDGVTGHILTEDASIEECLSTFERLLSEPERRHEIGQQARQLAEQRFSYEAIGERLRTVVEQAQAQA